MSKHEQLNQSIRPEVLPTKKFIHKENNVIKRNKVLQIGLGLLLGSPVWAAAPAMQIKDFARIRDMAVAADGSVWTVEYYAIKHLNPDGTLIKQFNYTDGSDYISAIALAPDGSVWLTNQNQKALLHFTAEGALISQFQIPGYYSATYSPPEIAIAADGSVWATDPSHNRVQHYQADGSLIAQFGAQGTSPGQFTSPNHIALAKDGSVWVTDGIEIVPDGSSQSVYAKSYRLQHFSADGKLIAQFGGKGTANGQFSNIADITIASDGSLWVADNNAFQHYQTDGTFIEKINSYGLGTNTATAILVKLATDGSLWTVGSDSFQGLLFLRHFNTNGSVVAQFKNKGHCLTEYDDVQQTVYLWNVAVGMQYYDVVLQFQKGRYNLVSATEDTPHTIVGMGCSEYSPTSMVFDISSNTLTIPFVQVIDTRYQATFTHMGGNSFVLQAATPLN